MKSLCLVGLLWPGVVHATPTEQDILNLIARHNAFLVELDLERAGEDEVRDRTYSAALDDCVLTWQDGTDPTVFRTLTVIDLAGATVTALPPVPAPSGTPVGRVSLRTSDAVMQGLAPALWAYMGGVPTQMPQAQEVQERYALHDPFGAGEWWDPSMMTLFQQRLADAKWDAAAGADETGMLALHYSAWLGPDRAFWTPELRTPGTNAQLLLPLGDAAAAAALIEAYVAAHCAGPA